MNVMQVATSITSMVPSSPPKPMRRGALSVSVVIALASSATLVRASCGGSGATLTPRSWSLRRMTDSYESMACWKRRQLLLRGGSSSSSSGSSGYNPDEWSTPAGRPSYVEDYGAYDEPTAPPSNTRQRHDGYYNQENEDDYDDYGRSRRRTGRPTSETTASAAVGLFSAMMPNIIQQGDRKIGLMLLASGISVSFLGFALFMNKTLLRLGNLLILAGVPVTLGPSRTVSYFVQPAKMRATSCLALGILLVFMGHPILGILLEVFGLLNLFGNMFPILMVFVKQMPVIGPLLQGNTSSNSNKSKKSGRSRRDDYDDDYDDYGGRERHTDYGADYRSNRPNY